MRIADTYNGSNLKQKHARSYMPRIRQVESERVCNFHLLEIDRLERAGGRGYAAWNKKLDPKKTLHSLTTIKRSDGDICVNKANSPGARSGREGP